MSKNSDKFISIIFVSFLIIILAYYPVKYVLLTKGYLTLDYNNFKDPVLKEEKNLFDKLENSFAKIKTNIENRATNYFPFYSSINYAYSTINYKLNKLFYNDNFVNIGKNADGEYLFRGDSFYVLENNLNNNTLTNKFAGQIDFFEKLSSEEVSVYLFLPKRYDLTRWHDENIQTRDYATYLAKVQELENSQFKVAVLDSQSAKEYQNYFYKTDHHWTAQGAYQGYQAIMQMMNIEPLKLSIYQTDIKFRGTMAKSAAQIDLYDYFSYIDYKGDYDVLVNGSINGKYKPKVLESNSKEFYDYYVAYYNGMFGEVKFDYHQSDKENLLIIADSYAWPIDEIIASHFNETYVINVRYDHFINGSLNYAEYIKEHNIQKVLILQEALSSLFDVYNYDTKGKVLGA